jgi:hypothetical protein
MQAVAKSKTKASSKKALEILDRVHGLSPRLGGPTQGMTKAEILRSIKKTREALWRQYLASRS